MNERNLLIRAKRRAGRIKRWLKRRWWERNTGREYRAWLAQAAASVPGSVANETPVAIIVPVFNPPVQYLDAALSSVLKQSASHWQLIVVDDGSTDPHVVEYLRAFQDRHAQDTRISVHRTANGGIAAAMNEGLAHVATDYFGWLDHDDALDPRCVEYCSAGLAGGDVDVVYSDEDKFDDAGRHFELYAKPSFSPELLITQMYLCHFTAFRTSLVTEIGGFRTAMDGAQDFDVALRLLPSIQRVVHIPRPLYHWRAWTHSTALSIDAKPWAQQATQRAQQDFLDRTFGGGTVKPSAIPGLNVVHPLVSGHPRVSVIIPTIGALDAAGKRLIETAISTLRSRERDAELQIVAVTTGELAPIPGADVQVVNPDDRFNFAQAIRHGREASDGDYLLILNDDTEALSENPVTRLLELGQQQDVGVVGAKLSYPDGRLQHVGIVLLPSGPTHPWIGRPAKEPGYFGSTLTPRNYTAVTAAAMLVRTEVFDEVQGLDPAFARDFNDVDFCLRVGQRGYRVAWSPYAHFIHHEGASMSRRAPDAGEASLFSTRWTESLAVDPYYSPALNPKLDRMYTPL